MLHHLGCRITVRKLDPASFPKNGTFVLDYKRRACHISSWFHFLHQRFGPSTLLISITSTNGPLTWSLFHFMPPSMTDVRLVKLWCFELGVHETQTKSRAYWCRDLNHLKERSQSTEISIIYHLIMKFTSWGLFSYSNDVVRTCHCYCSCSDFAKFGMKSCQTVSHAQKQWCTFLFRFIFNVICVKYANIWVNVI